MNFSFRNGLTALSAFGVGVLAVVLFRPSNEKDSLPGAAHEPYSPLEDHRLVLTDSGQHLQDATVQVTAEPVPQPSSATSVGPIAAQELSRSAADRIEMERVDRAPRPMLGGCGDHPKSSCRTREPLYIEPIDPNWSSATEDRLRDLWSKNVAGISDEFLFVMCKTTVCEVTYRFSKGATNEYGNSYFRPFWDAFRTSDLAAELCVTGISYGGIAVLGIGTSFKRMPSQREPQSNPKTSQQSFWCKD
jgi:hypothetical protein